MRRRLRLQRYSRRTEDVYVRWVKRFVEFHGRRHPKELAEAEISAFLSHLAEERRASGAYNAFHSCLAPALLAALGYVVGRPSLWPFCLIWLAHIGMDRALGLGLKFNTAFRDTHLGTIGRMALNSRGDR